MTDELKTVETDATKALADTKAQISKLGADEVSATGWIKTHYLYIVGALGLLLGFIAGHVVKL
jgi:hypothetical protein